jgi:hypothetical protein
MQDFDHISIDNLKLSKRIVHALERGHVFTVGDIKRLLSNKYLPRIRFIGTKSLDEILTALDELYKNPAQLIKTEKPSDQSIVTINKVHADIFDNIPIDSLQLPRAIRGSLKKNKIRTFGELRKLSNKELLNINRIGPKSLEEIRQVITDTVNKADEYLIKNTTGEESNPMPIALNPVLQENLVGNWADAIQSYLESEKSTYLYVLISRFGYKPKKLEEIAKELGVSRERVRQIQDLGAGRFLKYLKLSRAGFSNTMVLLREINNILSTYGEDLSLARFKLLLQEKNLLGEFPKTLMNERIKEIDLLETLICWLNLLANKRYNMQPIVFPIDIRDLVHSGNVSIKDHAALSNISPQDRRKIKRKVLFTGGITIRETIKMLSIDEKIAILLLKSLNLQKVDAEWFSIKNLDRDKEKSKIPLRMAGLKMLAVTPDVDIDTFHEGLRRHASRLYSGIAPMHVINHILPVLGFEINNSKVTTRLLTKGILSESEKSLISAIRKNGDAASFLEIAEEFFLQKLSLPAVSVTLKRSPIVEKVDEGLYKLRGADISWQQIEDVKKRQKRFSQDNEVTHGLDGVVRMKFTVNSYAFLTGVVGAYSIKELSGSWSVVHEGTSLGEAKIDEAYLWGLANLFKKLDIKMGERIELALNTWNRIKWIGKFRQKNGHN